MRDKEVFFYPGERYLVRESREILLKGYSPPAPNTIDDASLMDEEVFCSTQVHRLITVSLRNSHQVVRSDTLPWESETLREFDAKSNRKKIARSRRMVY